MKERADLSASAVAVFGPYHLRLDTRQLFRNGEPVALGGRAADLLFALIERRGEVMSKQDLIARAWPNLFVEDANLRVQVAALRRALGDGHGQQRFIINVAGRGYSFVAPVELIDEAEPLPRPSIITPRQNLPYSLNSLVGRERDLALVENKLVKGRLVTLVGPGGVGKTTVALAAARAQLAHRDGVILVELAGISQPASVPGAVTSAVQLTVSERYRSLSDDFPLDRGLIVLDNCEHVISAAASVAESLLRKSATLTIIATSREPLRAEGESVIRLSGLDVPAHGGEGFSSHELSLSSAVRLFIDRAGAVLGDYEPKPSELADIAHLCRRLDGNPLAIELAAGRSDAFGVPGLLRQLDDVFGLLVGGRRTALDRQRTLEATLDWSFAHLTAQEQATFARLSVFAGHFSLESAARVISLDEPTWETVENITSLVSKSLVSTDFSQDLPRYRLLDTTRSYAQRKLEEQGELDRMQKRHALHMKEMMVLAEGNWENSADWRIKYGSDIDNIRSALNWCYSNHGDIDLAVDLTVRSAFLFFQLWLVEEGCNYFQRASRALQGSCNGNPDNAVSLLTSLSVALIYTLGPGPEARVPLEQALAIARTVNVTSLNLQALLYVWIYDFCSADFRSALNSALEFKSVALASTSVNDMPARRVADRMVGSTHLHLGNLLEAQKSLVAALSGDATSQKIRMQLDHQLVCRAWNAITLWYLGRSDEARDMAISCLNDARQNGHVPTILLVLVETVCPMTMFDEDYDALESYVDDLQNVAAKYPTGPWRAWGECFRGSLFLGHGRFEASAEQLERGLALLSETRWRIHRALFLSQLTQAYTGLGKHEAALTMIEEAIELATITGDAWIMPELLRAKADVLRTIQPGEALKFLKEALRIAEQSSMGAWLRRCAITSSHFA